MGLGISIAVNGRPDKELTQANNVEVSERMGEATTYVIRYDLDISEGDLPLLIDDRFKPGSELAILAPVDNSVNWLVKGPVHNQQVHLEHGGAGSWIEVRGADTSIVMDRISQSSVWSNVKDSDVVNSIVSNYGYIPDVQYTFAGHFENKHALIQRESDLSFVRRLARRNGYLFWISCNEMGIETAHFKRPPLQGNASAELIINLESPNINAIDINWDVERPTSINGKQLDLNSKTVMDIAVAKTPQQVLGKDGLSTITNDTRSVHLSAPADDAGDMQARGEGAIIEADWFIRANCQTSAEELGTIVRAHSLVELRGAGSRYSGKYFVAAVRHSINAAQHIMDLELIRNAWG